MLKKHPLLLSTLFFAASMQLNAQQEEIIVAPVNQVEFRATAVAQSCTPFTGAVMGSKVRLRAAPNLEGYVVRELANGELFVVTGETHDYYTVVPPRDSKGYVFRTFILDGIVEGDRVNVRLFPDTDAPVVGQLNRGDRVASSICETNNKWLEISLPETSRFYIAKEYIEQKGPIELYALIEKKKMEAAHRLSAASLFAQAEIQKPFEQVDLDRITEKFETIAKEYHELPTIAAQVREALGVVQDIYVEKKIAFLDGKANIKRAEISPAYFEKLAKLNSEESADRNVSDIASAATKTLGLASTIGEGDITDKMLVWQPLEESVYHLWAAANGERGIHDFYSEERQSAMLLTGIVEPYNRPVKNRPGDFILREGSLPVAFLYSTRINLEKLVGQKITVLASPRPNHNFAFPAYFVISVE